MPQTWCWLLKSHAAVTCKELWHRLRRGLLIFSLFNVFSWPGNRSRQKKTNKQQFLLLIRIRPPCLTSRTSPSVCPIRSRSTTSGTLSAPLRPKHNHRMSLMRHLRSLRRRPWQCQTKLFSQLWFQRVEENWANQKRRILGRQLQLLSSKLPQRQPVWQRRNRHGVPPVLHFSCRWQMNQVLLLSILPSQRWRRSLLSRNLWKPQERDLLSWPSLSRNLHLQVCRF